MRRQHHLPRMFLVHAELRLEDEHHEVARGKIVVDENHFIKPRPLDFRRDDRPQIGTTCAHQETPRPPDQPTGLISRRPQLPHRQ